MKPKVFVTRIIPDSGLEKIKQYCETEIWQERLPPPYEVLLEKDLRRKGWRRLRVFKELSNTDTGEMAVFYRYCEAGETHSIRTEKYAAPMLLIR